MRVRVNIKDEGVRVWSMKREEEKEGGDNEEKVG